jgi:hypothetical protein
VRIRQNKGLLLTSGYVVGVVTLLLAIGGLNTRLGGVKRLEEDVRQLHEANSKLENLDLPSMRKEVSSTRRSLPRAGTVEVEVARGQASGRSTVDIAGLEGRLPMLWVEAADATVKVNRLRGRIDRSPADESSARIVVEVELPVADRVRSVTVKWLVVQ